MRRSRPSPLGEGAEFTRRMRFKNEIKILEKVKIKKFYFPYNLIRFLLRKIHLPQRGRSGCRKSYVKKMKIKSCTNDSDRKTIRKALPLGELPTKVG